MPLGGKRSSGLGRCQLTQLQVHALDLSVANITERSRRLRGYLLGKTLAEKMPALADAQAFLQENIKRLLG